jgi:hypothetical protein
VCVLGRGEIKGLFFGSFAHLAGDMLLFPAAISVLWATRSPSFGVIAKNLDADPLYACFDRECSLTGTASRAFLRHTTDTIIEAPSGLPPSLKLRQNRREPGARDLALRRKRGFPPRPPGCSPLRPSRRRRKRCHCSLSCADTCFESCQKERLRWTEK